MPQVFWPFPTATVTEWPGQRPGSYHVGTDFGIPQGTPLRATVDGTIVRHNSDGFGAYVLDIISDDGLLVRNGHLSRMDVNTGQRVSAGQVIGLTGGRPGTPGAGYSTGPHLHWELRWDRAWSGGRWVDPRKMNPPVVNFGEVSVQRLEKFMRVFWDTNNKAYLATDEGIVWIENGRDYDLFVRLINCTPESREVFLSAEVDIMNNYLRRLAKSNNTFEGTVTAQVDYGKIAKTVNDDAARRMQG